MSKLCKLLDPIEAATGKIAPTTQKRKNGGFGRFFGFRTLTTTGGRGQIDAPRIIMAFYKNPRSTPYTAAELARWDKFSGVSKAVKRVMRSPQELQQAQAEFAAQTTFKKLRAYIWDREWANYEG